MKFKPWDSNHSPKNPCMEYFTYIWLTFAAKSIGKHIPYMEHMGLNTSWLVGSGSGILKFHWLNMSGYLGFSSRWQRLHPKWKIDSSSHYLQSFFIHPRWWLPDFWRINNTWISWRATTNHLQQRIVTILVHLGTNLLLQTNHVSNETRVTWLPPHLGSLRGRHGQQGRFECLAVGDWRCIQEVTNRTVRERTPRKTWVSNSSSLVTYEGKVRI